MNPAAPPAAAQRSRRVTVLAWAVIVIAALATPISFISLLMILSGGDGSDRIRGGAGNDTISGGQGFNILIGEEGADTFTFERDPNGPLPASIDFSQMTNAERAAWLEGDHIIEDFTPGVDKIRLENFVGFDFSYFDLNGDGFLDPSDGDVFAGSSFARPVLSNSLLGTEFLMPAGPGAVTVREHLRRRVRFGRHDLDAAAGPPDGAPFHLVCCRNVVIYFQPALQRRALRLLAESLLPGGVLCLGEAEWEGELAGMLEPVDRRRKLYRRAATKPAPR